MGRRDSVTALLIDKGFPLSNRLIRELHGILLPHGRGADKGPVNSVAPGNGLAARDAGMRFPLLDQHGHLDYDELITSGHDKGEI